MNNQALKFARNKKNWTQDQLGNELGVKKQTISHWEKGRIQMPPKYAAKIHELLGLTERDLFPEMFRDNSLAQFKADNAFDDEHDDVMEYGNSIEMRNLCMQIRELEYKIHQAKTQDNAKYDIAHQDHIKDLSSQLALLKSKRNFLQKKEDQHQTINTSHETAPLTEVSPPTHKFTSVPVLSFAQAAGFEPAIEPINDFLNNHSDTQEPFANVKPGYFALQITGDSMSPEYPDGTVILVAGGEFPQRGDIVAAKLSSGEVVVKLYHRKDNVVSLTSINPAGKNFQWHIKENPGYAVWIFPVVEAKINIRRRRWECRNIN